MMTEFFDMNEREDWKPVQKLSDAVTENYLLLIRYTFHNHLYSITYLNEKLRKALNSEDLEY